VVVGQRVGIAVYDAALGFLDAVLAPSLGLTLAA